MTFPIRALGPAEHSANLPQQADIVVIGGGIIGVCTALYAARAGQRVVVLEKGRVAAEQSSRNWGWIRVQGRDYAEIPIALQAQLLWKKLDADCGGRLGLAQPGVTYMARDQADLERYESWLERARPLGVSSELTSARDTVRLTGGARAPWIGALHTPTDHTANPWVAVPELARLAVASGATIIEDCAVRALDLQGGKVTGVFTEKGAIKAPRVVLAGGAWSSLFLRRHGVSIPQLSVKASVAATSPVPEVMSSAGASEGLALTRRRDGGYTLAPGGFADLFLGPDALRAIPNYLTLLREDGMPGRLRRAAPDGFPDAWNTLRDWPEDAISPFERMRVLDPAPDLSRLHDLVARVQTIWPQVGPMHITKAWGGMIDVMPDVVPVVDHVPALAGLIAVTGMCGHGFGIGPAFGQIAAQLAMGRAGQYDLNRFRFVRFADGSKMQLGPNV
ncbi:MAG: NAD(P)/FAD-dependent oxidoreductase [Pelagimonas sp.]|uniref:NAD(P)/FAD-dependent oxidoreductase n=1 Tax=Pelagimonas sp. TaxID=2073170 RepID=UPI003D6ABA77